MKKFSKTLLLVLPLLGCIIFGLTGSRSEAGEPSSTIVDSICSGFNADDIVCGIFPSAPKIDTKKQCVDAGNRAIQEGLSLASIVYNSCTAPREPIVGSKWGSAALTWHELECFQKATQILSTEPKMVVIRDVCQGVFNDTRSDGINPFDMWAGRSCYIRLFWHLSRGNL